MTLDEIVEALNSTPVVLAQLVGRLSEDALRAGHDADSWSIKEVVLHLRDTEEVMLGRFERTAREDIPFLPAYDQEAYARDRRYQDAAVAPALGEFTQLRGKVVALFRGLDPDDLERAATHEERGRVTLRALVEHVIAHDLVHLSQIARAL